MIEFKTIGEYVLCRTIGNGTFSKVKLGINRATREKVAIKIIDKNQINHKKDLQRIHREIKILKSTSHNNIVKIKTVHLI
jgi:5'-AMP-activated protein kinase catalytic alpha subunit